MIPGNQNLPPNWISWQFHPESNGRVQLMLRIILPNKYLSLTFNGRGKSAEQWTPEVGLALSELSQQASRGWGIKVLPARAPRVRESESSLTWKQN